MSNYITLFKSFAIAMKDYITRHNANYSAIENAINAIYNMVGSSIASTSYHLAFKKFLIDRALSGLIPMILMKQHFPIQLQLHSQSRAYYNDAFYYITEETTLSMSGHARIHIILILILLKPIRK